MGNRSIAAGTLYSDASPSVSFAITGPTAALGTTAESSSGVSFTVTYATAAGGSIEVSSLGHQEIQVTGPNGFSQFATLVSVNPDANGSPLAAAYRIDAPNGTWDAGNDGTYTISVEPDTVRDNNGDTVQAGALGSFSILALQPTIAPATGQATLTAGTTINLVVTFNQPVSGLTSSDITLGGTAGATTATVTKDATITDGTKWDVAVSGMTQYGTVIATIPAGAVTDSAGMGNPAASNSANPITYTPLGVSVGLATGQSTTTNVSPINFTVTFTQPVTDFSSSGVTLAGTAGATTAVVTPVGTAGTTYNVAVSGMAQDGSVTIAIASDVAHNAAGNPNAAALHSAGVEYQAQPPKVTVASASGTISNSSTINFTVTFSNAVTGFSSSGVTLGGTAGATTAIVTPVGTAGTTYNVAVSGMNKGGTVTVSVPARADDDGRQPQCGLVQSGQRRIHAAGRHRPAGRRPASGTNQGPINFTVTFSEAVTDFMTGNVTLSGTAGATTALVTGSGTTYTVAVSGMTSNGHR